MPVKNKMSRIVSKILLLRDMPTPTINTTLATAVNKGATTVTLTSGAGLANGQILRIGDGEEYEPIVVGSFAGAVVTLADTGGTNLAHAAAQTIKSQLAYDLGDITDKGATVTVNGESIDVNVATKRLVYTIINGYATIQCELEVPQLTLQNFAMATGIPFAQIIGAGTPTSPLTLTTDGNLFGSEQNQSLVIISTLMDGTFLREELWGVDFDYTGISFKMSRGQLSSIPLKGMASSGYLVTTVANPYALTSTFTPTKGKVFDRLTEVGLYIVQPTSPGSTTVGTLAPAGQKVVPVPVTTNFVSGDWVKFGAGELAEYHQVDSVIAATSITLRTALLRDQAVGVTVVEQIQSVLASIDENGVTISLGGSMTKIRSATRRLDLGNRAGAALLNVMFNLMELSLTTVSLALGIPTSDTIGGLKTDAITNAGTVFQDGFYLKGLLQDGTNVQIDCWGNSADLGGIAHTFGQANVTSVPVKLRPASALRLMQNT